MAWKVKEKYFTNESKSKKKKVKTREIKIEEDLNFIGGNNGN